MRGTLTTPKPAGRVAPRERALAVRSAAVTERAARIGVLASRRVLRAMLAEASARFRRGQDPTIGLRESFAALAPTLRDSMLLARLRALQLQAEEATQPTPLTSAELRGALDRDSAFRRGLRTIQRRIFLTDAQLREMERQADAHVVRVLATVFEDTQRALAAEVAAIHAEGLHVREGVKRLTKLLADRGLTLSNPYQIETIYRTQTQLAFAAGKAEWDQQPAVQNILWGYKYITAGDDRVRPEHAVLDGITLPKDDPWWLSNKPPLGWACFPAGVRVSGAFTGGTRVWYDGPIVVLETSNGVRLPLTVNHPVATRRGWVAANLIHDGDDLVCHRAEVERVVARALDDVVSSPPVSRRTVHSDDVPAAIEKVYDALRRNGILLDSRGVVPLDFHGDAQFFKGNIDVVNINRVLQSWRQAGVTKRRNQVIEKAMHARAVLPGKRASHFLQRTSLFFPPNIRTPCSHALSFNCHPIALDRPPLDPLLFGCAAELNGRVAEPPGDRAAVYAGFLRELIDAGSGLIAFDQVVNVERHSFSGHVYDLQSVSSELSGNGWMISNGIVTSNCRCVLLSIFKPREIVPPPDSASIDGKPIRIGADPGFAFDPGTLFPATV